MKHILLLLHKDLLIWLNSYWRTSKQAVTNLIVAAILILFVAFITQEILNWFIPMTEAFKGALTADLLSPMTFLVLVWQFISAFFSTIQSNRNTLFLAPDLTLLIATPVDPKIIFTQRFLIFIFFNPFSFIDAVIFGYAPLAALGLMAGAPVFYFVLLLPLIYLYRVIPIAIAVALNMALLRLLSPRRMYRVLAVINFIIGILPIVFFFSRQQDRLSVWAAQLADIEFILWGLPYLTAMRDLTISLMGGSLDIWLPFVILLGSIFMFAFLGLVVVQKTYYHNYELMQTTELRSLKNPKLSRHMTGVKSIAMLPMLWFLALEHLKSAIRNKEMIPGGILLIFLLFVYAITMGGFAGGQLWLMLLNVIAVAFCAQSVIFILFIPINIAADHLVLQQQYWLFKIAPIGDRTFAGSLFLSNCLPSLALALVLIIPINHITGFVYLGLLQTVILVMLIVSGVSLHQLTMLIEASTIGEEVTLLTRVMREATILYYPLFILPVAVAFYYRYIGFLSFMHNLPQSEVIAFSVLGTIVLAIIISLKAFYSSASVYHNMEIK